MVGMQSPLSLGQSNHFLCFILLPLRQLKAISTRGLTRNPAHHATSYYSNDLMFGEDFVFKLMILGRLLKKVIF